MQHSTNSVNSNFKLKYKKNKQSININFKIKGVQCSVIVYITNSEKYFLVGYHGVT